MWPSFPGVTWKLLLSAQVYGGARSSRTMGIGGEDGCPIISHGPGYQAARSVGVFHAHHFDMFDHEWPVISGQFDKSDYQCH